MKLLKLKKWISYMGMVLDSRLTFAHQLFAVRNNILHWLSTTQQLVLKQCMLLSIHFHNCSVWEQHRPWYAARVHLLSAIFSDAPSPSCIPASRYQGMSGLANGVVRHADLNDQSNDFHSTYSSIVCALKGWWWTQRQKANGNKCIR
jgi:hypothetical protein